MAPIPAPDGTLYGTTSGGGGFDTGTVFRMAPDGSRFTLLHSFGGYPTDGSDPGGLVKGSDGTLYGTTGGGGVNATGTVFQVAPDGGYTLLYQFHPETAYGRNPRSAVIQGADGTLYGTTQNGGLCFDPG